MNDNNKFYPKGLENGDMKLSNKGKNISKFRINRIKIFIPINNKLIQSFAYKGHNPIGFIDIVEPNSEYKYMKGKEIHIGITGEFETEELFKSGVKMNRIDIDVPLNEMDNFISSIKEAKA